MGTGEGDLLAGLVRMISAATAAPALDAVVMSRAVLATVAPDDAASLVEVARDHGVEAWVAASAPPSWPVEVLADLRAQRHRFAAARARQQALLEDLSSAFLAADVPWLVLKGRAIADRVYPRPDLRFGVDIDVLVEPASFGRAVAAAQGVGKLVDVNWPLVHRLQVGELRVLSRNGTTIDLHWHLLNDRLLRDRFDLPTAALIERLVPSEDGTYRRLGPLDELVHVCLHAATSGANRLMWLVDVDRLVRHDRVDWPGLVAAARGARAAAAVALVLSRSRRVLGTPVPEPVLRQLAGSGWAVACALAERTRADGLDVVPSGPSLGRAMARSARGGLADSLATLARHGAQFVAGARHSGAPARWLDPADPTSAMYEVESAADRDAYLALVATQS